MRLTGGKKYTASYIVQCFLTIADLTFFYL
jgi:hypothetical protein